MNNEGFPRRAIDEDVTARIFNEVSSQRSLFNDIWPPQSFTDIVAPRRLMEDDRCISLFVTCLDFNATSSSQINIEELNAKGLGVPLSEREGSQRKPTQFLDYWTYEQVISKIKSLFPNLQADFDLCRRDTASLKLVSLGTCKNAATIKSSLASSLLYVVPIKAKSNDERVSLTSQVTVECYEDISSAAPAGPNDCHDHSSSGNNNRSPDHQAKDQIQQASEETTSLMTEVEMTTAASRNDITGEDDDEDDDDSLFLFTLPSKHPLTSTASDTDDSYSSDSSEDLYYNNTIDLEVARSLKEISHKISKSETFHFNVDRMDIWNSAISMFYNPRFAPLRKMRVSFVDFNGRSEDATDFGGPKREFLRLLMEHIQESDLFTGPMTARHLSLNKDAMAKDEYYYAGMSVAMSIIHSGPSPSFLSPVLYDAICSEHPESVAVTPDEVYDPHWRGVLFEIRQSALQYVENVEEVPLQVAAKFSQRNKQLVDELSYWVVLGRVQPAFSRFVAGLSAVGLLDIMKANKRVYRKLFCSSDSCMLTGEILHSLFYTEFSKQESAKFKIELEIYYFWSRLIDDVEAGQCEIFLKDILIFFTGSNSIPALGLFPQPLIKFQHDPVTPFMRPSFESKYLMADTCCNTIKLPTCHKTYEDFKKYAIESIVQSDRFGFL